MENNKTRWGGGGKAQSNNLICYKVTCDLLRGWAILPHFIGLITVDAHNQLVLGPNGIRVTCATCIWYLHCTPTEVLLG